MCGAWIKFSAHGDRDSKFGWEIHHIKAESKGGSNDITNLIPLHWKNNIDTGNDDKITCTVRSNGNSNVGLSTHPNTLQYIIIDAMFTNAR